MKSIFIIGCKGIPANYGGFETFTDNLVTRKKSSLLQYYVTCLSDKKSDNKLKNYHNAVCKNIYVPKMGGIRAILYDLKSLEWALNKIDKDNLDSGYIYILGCTIGPLIDLYREKFKKRGFNFFLNPDGHEWKRDKWPLPVKKYLKFSEKSMVKKADLIICDSVSIEKYIKSDYKRYNPKTKYISYGSDIIGTKLTSKTYKVKKFFSKFSITENNYYLVVGRFVPENNYETIIREFMQSNTSKDLVIITNYFGSKFFNELKKKTGFNKDSRIKFVGTVYDADLLKYIREKAFAYIHGHSVGGTNPSLLEALGATKLNLLYEVGFNKEVANDSALYWNLKEGNLSNLINNVDDFGYYKRNSYEKKAKQVIKERYSWNKIISEYEELFLE